eukprot:TRINITY_DN126220_c0_g1_i1.p1 TRINITY_DN126220_c0_g1~~TRINITY_DN126220_c0_g1_i1.p1  ORF type:complete len:247 (+),score=37.07 TRINITY_DN126220_c0_g1_i1:63-803(+)
MAADVASAARKVCVVAGVGEKGIGDHVSKKFASEGYAVAMLARRKENLDALEKEISGSKGYQCDVSKHDQLHAAIEAITADLGPIDVLIVNTSAGPFKPFAETSQEEFDLALATGPSALFAFAKAVTPGMIERGHGVIGVTGATASWRGMPATCAKAAGNFAMRAVAQSLARDMAPKGIHVFHVIIDGMVDQPRTHSWMPSKPDEEFLSPSDIAETYWALANQSPKCWGFEINLMAAPCFGTMASI